MVQPSIQQFYPLQVPSTPPRQPKTHEVESMDEIAVLKALVFREVSEEEALKKGPDLCDLSPGPIRLNLVCRIIALQHHSTPSSSAKSLKSKGSWKLCVKDDTAAMTVLLYYNRGQYLPVLGALVRIEAAHVSHGNNKVKTFDCTSLFVSMFPERDNSCAFQRGDFDFANSVLLVCVKSLGPKIERTVKKGTEKEPKVHMCEVRVFDQTGQSLATFWDGLAASPASWTANATVLMIYSAGYDEARAELQIRNNTYVDVTPDCAEAKRLAEWIEEKFKSGVTDNIEPPADTFDVEEAMAGQQRSLFSIAMMDEWWVWTTEVLMEFDVRRARDAPAGTPITGYFSLIILDLNICGLRVRRELCSSHW